MKQTLCINQFWFSNISLSEKVVSAAHLFCRLVVKQTIKTNAHWREEAEYDFQLQFLFFKWFSSVFCIKEKYCTFMHNAVNWLQRHVQFHGCLILIQCTKVKIGRKISIPRVKTVLEIRIYSLFPSSCFNRSKNLPKTRIFYAL